MLPAVLPWSEPRRPLSRRYAPASGDLRHNGVHEQWVWPKAVHRVAADGISPEHAVADAIARTKLNE